MKRIHWLWPALMACPAMANGLNPMETLGKSLFFDTSLSVNGNQSCSFCHDPAAGFAASDSDADLGGGVVQGSVEGLFGNRKPPTASYAYAIPVLHHIMEDGAPLFIGGAFHDGRARGDVTGTPVGDQAMGPFLNPAEMALPAAACVVARVCAEGADDGYPVKLSDIDPAACSMTLPASVAADCAQPAGMVTLDDATSAAVESSFHTIARALGAYEASSEVSPFSSRYDAWAKGKGTLSDQELAGMKLFEDKAMCAECHVLDPGPHGEPPLFTDFTYDNLGVPKNPANPWYKMAANTAGADWVDHGLADTLATDAIYAPFASFLDGKQKVPTLRNVDARADADSPRAYMHNGYFKTLKGVVHFYNTRDVLPVCATDLTEAEALAQKCWPAAEVPATVNHDELGDLGLTDAEEDDVVAFMKTLTDQPAK